MGIGVRAVIKKFEKYVGYIDTARISETKANTRNYKWYYKMKPANNWKETGGHVQPDVRVKNDTKLYFIGAAFEGLDTNNTLNGTW